MENDDSALLVQENVNTNARIKLSAVVGALSVGIVGYKFGQLVSPNGDGAMRAVQYTSETIAAVGSIIFGGATGLAIGQFLFDGGLQRVPRDET